MKLLTGATLLLLSGNLFALNCNEPNTQIEINQCSADAFSKADKQLNDTWKSLLSQFENDKHKIQQLRTAQLAWIAFRDAEVEALFPCEEENKRICWGSMYPTQHNDAMTRLTNERITSLGSHLNSSGEDSLSASPELTESTKSCYKNEYTFKDNPKDKDVIALDMEISGDSVVGVYSWLPAFKDKRVGEFTGSLASDVITADYRFMQEGEEDKAAITITLKDDEVVVAGGDVGLGLGATIKKVACS